MIDEYINWLEKSKGLRQNTIRMYRRYLQELPEIDLESMSEEEIRGTINSQLVDTPNNIAKCAYVNYIRFLYTTLSHNDPVQYDRLRLKKNNIISNLELPVGLEYALDLEKSYINKVKFMRVWHELDINLKYVVTLLYDSSARINELLLNDWKNIDESCIFIPRRLAKSHRDRTVEWLMPESRDIIRQLKSSGTFQDTLNTKYNAIWYALSSRVLGDMAYNPHSLRHTRLSDLSADGWDIGRLQQRAGHSDVKTTQRYLSWTVHHRKDVMSLEKWCALKDIKLFEEF